MESMNQQNAVTLFVKVVVKQNSIAKAGEALLAADVRGARKEPGNCTMELYQGDNNPDVVYLFERWQNQSMLEEHFKQPYTKAAFDLQQAGSDDRCYDQNSSIRQRKVPQCTSAIC